MDKSDKPKGKRFYSGRFVLNCIPSENPEDDWTFEDAVDAGVVQPYVSDSEPVDLRRNWWKVNNQGRTGACVGYATAYGVLRWHYVKEGKIDEDELPSARFIWMANKETDEITSYPTTFIESAGTQTKLALGVARNYGCVLEQDLPMTGRLATMNRAAFYTKAARLRIASYHNLGMNHKMWRHWIANQGPLLTRLVVDRTWDRATQTDGYLEKYLPDTARGGHAVSLVGFTDDYFIVRNSWGVGWGDGGFAYALDEYIQDGFMEAYGAVM
jgi:hypothetical protein